MKVLNISVIVIQNVDLQIKYITCKEYSIKRKLIWLPPTIIQEIFLILAVAQENFYLPAKKNGWVTKGIEQMIEREISPV